MAIGVSGEVQFSIMAFRREKELKRRSEKKIAELNAQTAEARARTAEVEKLTAWRRITPNQLEQFTEAIQPIASTISLWLEFQNSDIEALRYAQDIGLAFEKCRIANFGYTGNSFIPITAFGLGITTDGVDIDILKKAFENFVPPVFIVPGSLALKQISSHTWRPNLYIFVGPKVPPEMFGEDTPPPLSTPPA